MILVTPPASPVVSLEALRLHLRVDEGAEDALILALEKAAVAYLDGWRGVLGRAINEQVWRQEFTAWGDLRLVMQDVTAVAVTYLDENDEEQPATSVELRQTASGPVVIASGPAAQRIFVNMTCGLPAEVKPAVVAVICLLVAHWYQNREAVGPVMREVPVAAHAMISSLRAANL